MAEDRADHDQKNLECLLACVLDCLSECTKKREPPSRIQTIVRCVDGVNALVLRVCKFALLVIVVPLVAWFAYRDVSKPALVMEAIAVSAGMARQGYTSEVVTGMLVDDIQQMRSTATTELRNELSFGQSADSPIHQIEIPGTEMTLSTIVSFLQSVLHRTPPRCGGEVRRTGNEVALALRFIEPGGDRATPKPFLVCGQLRDLSHTFQEAAIYVETHVEPVVLGSYYWEKSKYREARTVLRFALTHEPKTDDCWAHNLLGILDEREHDSSSAEREYRLAADAARASRQSLPHPWVNLGFLLESQVKHESNMKHQPATRCKESRACYETALREEKHFVPACYRLGVWFTQHDVDGNEDLNAEEMFTKAIHYDGHYTPAYLELGNLLWREKRVREAEMLFTKMVDLFPDEPPASEIFLQWGNGAYNNNKADEAILRYKQAIHSNPNRFEGYNNLCRTLIYKYDDKGRREVLQRLRRIQRDKTINNSVRVQARKLEQDIKLGMK